MNLRGTAGLLEAWGAAKRYFWRGWITPCMAPMVMMRSSCSRGPVPHRHSREDGPFYVLEGPLEFRIGDRTISAPAGSFLFAPNLSVATGEQSDAVTE
jgi:hypothetical protein